MTLKIPSKMSNIEVLACALALPALKPDEISLPKENMLYATKATVTAMAGLAFRLKRS